MVTLSAGPLGGQEVDGSDWEIGTEKVFEGLKYRRDTESDAVYTGQA